MISEKLKGIMPALMTAFTDDALDTAKIAALVRRLGTVGIHGLYVGGSSGEMVLCTQDERRELLECVMANRGDMTVIAHVGAFSTRDTVALARHARAVGADAVSSVTPLYYKYTFEQIKIFYQRIAEAAELPVIIYNFPAISGTTLTYDQLSELLSLPGIGGMKFTCSDFFQLNCLVRAFPDKVFYNGSDEMLCSGLAAGAHGGIGTTYNFMPRQFLKVYNAFMAGDIADAQKNQSLANDVIAEVLKYGVVPACKAMIGLAGLDYGICREPFQPLTNAQIDSLRENAWKLVAESESF